MTRLVESHRDFAALCECCDGAWPGAIKEALNLIGSPGARRLLESSRASGSRVRCDRRLPLPHLLDADWRFTRDGAEAVLDALLRASDRDLLLIGMPSVALVAGDRGLSSRITIASRPDDPIDDALRSALPAARFLDLRRLPGDAFGAAALDPPWYDDVAGPLIAAARRAVAPKGTVLICAPDRFTLPSSARTFDDLLSRPEGSGFSTSATTARIRYTTPFFELRTLEAVGITNVSPTWRTGTLIACEVGLENGVGAPTVQGASEWSEARVGRVRLWVRRRERSPGGAPIIRIVESISRTHPIRDIAQVWTSGNSVASGLPLPDGAFTSSECSTGSGGAIEEMIAATIRDEEDAVDRAVEFV